MAQLSKNDTSIMRPPSQPSSRRDLTVALELAQRAVQLDGEHRYDAAIAVYGQSISMLAAVMEQLRASTTHTRVRSSEAREEELRRLGIIVRSAQEVLFKKSEFG